MSHVPDMRQSEFYNYMAPINMDEGLEPLFSDLVRTAAFQRLRDVKFLGGIDYLLVRAPNGAPTNARFTRFQHSLGVARLALLYADLKNLPRCSRQLAYAAALLHDIGHAPLSHSLEPVFEEEFGVNHHEIAEEIITGKNSLGAEVFSVLKSYGVDPEQVIAIISGDDDPFDGFFSGPINFDTIEGVLRSRRYVNPVAISPLPTDIVRAATFRNSPADRQLVDSFWRCKDEVYRIVIRSRPGVTADYLCQRVARKCLTKQDFFKTEKALFAKLPKLRHVLKVCRSPSKEMLNIFEPISYKERNFHIDQEGDFFERNDKRRYRQSKREKVLFMHGELA